MPLKKMIVVSRLLLFLRRRRVQIDHLRFVHEHPAKSFILNRDAQITESLLKGFPGLSSND